MAMPAGIFKQPPIDPGSEHPALVEDILDDYLKLEAYLANETPENAAVLDASYGTLINRWRKLWQSGERDRIIEEYFRDQRNILRERIKAAGGGPEAREKVFAEVRATLPPTSERSYDTE